MTNKRIQELVKFFYGPRWRQRIPLKISCNTGEFSGFDISKDSFIVLMKILSKSNNLKSDLTKFRDIREKR